MAAIQSRARTQHQHHQHQYSNEDGDSEVSAVGASSGRTGAAAGEESWLLFAPQPPSSSKESAHPAGNRAIDIAGSGISGEEAANEDPFQHPDDSLSSTSAWQVVVHSSKSSLSPRPEQQHHLDDATCRSPSSPRHAASGQLKMMMEDMEDWQDDADNNNNAAAAANTRWSAVPQPRRDGSSFFDDEDEEDSLFSDKQLLLDRPSADPASRSIYPDALHLQSAPSKHATEDTDMLSLPSSLSVSDRSTSDALPSPRFDYPETAFALTTDADADAPQHHAIGGSSITLTEAALSRIATGETAHAKEPEATLTSGSEDEAEDAEEAALSRAPDAISAGIRPSRRRALQSIRAPSQLSSALSGSRLSQKSATKRRHRQSGISDKGSKRSNTSASLLTVQEIQQTPTLPRSSRDRSSDQHPTQTQRQTASPTRGRAARFTQAAKQAAREMFSVDEEVMNMMAQPGSVFSQARPSSNHSSRYSDDMHALSAFSAHMASELGDSPGIHGLFASAYDEDQTIDSGNETETEAAPQSRQYRHRRSRRRSSLFADDAPSHSIAPSSPRGPESSLTADQLHTASLGLHRSFTFASFQHFLIDSVYNSLSSSLLAGTPRSPSMSSSAHPQQTLSSSSSFMSVRKRTTSAPTIERSQSSSDLYTQADEQQEILEYKEAVSYWRRVLRSFAL